MHIRQEKQIRTFLIEEFGTAQGSSLFDRQEKILRALIGRQEGKSTLQRQALIRTILPCIALYQALLEDGLAEAAAYDCARKYMMDKVAAKMHASAARAEIIPGFYAIYSSLFLLVTRATGLWASRQARGKGYFDVTITGCLWHTACAESGCPALCRAFCEADNVTYGGLQKIGFTRTQTLGCGGSCCDFHFYRK